MRALTAAVLAALLAACSTPQSRIRKHQAQFDSYPPDVQEKIKKGDVEVGFTFDQVEMALGAPDRTFSQTEANRSQEIWSYGGGAEPSPTIGFGFGFGGWHHGTAAGLAVGGPGPYVYEDRIRIVFEGGRVASIRRRDR